MRSYERFKPLRLEEGGLAGGYKDIQPGDCVVAFSRRHIYDIKHNIEVATGHRCGIACPQSMRLCGLCAFPPAKHTVTGAGGCSNPACLLHVTAPPCHQGSCKASAPASFPFILCNSISAHDYLPRGVCGAPEAACGGMEHVMHLAVLWTWQRQRRAGGQQ